MDTLILLVYVGLPLVILVLAVLFYLRSRESRRGLRCPQCGEYVRVELMDTDQRCNTCGAPLDLTEERHAQP